MNMFQPASESPTCPKCNRLARVDISGGQTVIWCGWCQLEFPIELRGQVKHDQRERLEQTLKRSSTF